MFALLPQCVAQLPRAGEYKGTLTSMMARKGPAGKESGTAVRTVCKASARIAEDGSVRILYTAKRDQIVGKFRKAGNNILLDLAHGSLGVLSSTDSFQFAVGTPHPNPRFQSARIRYVTELKRVGD